MVWVLFFFPCSTHTWKGQGNHFILTALEQEAKGKEYLKDPLCFSSLHTAVPREKRSEFPLSPRDLKIQQCPHRCQNNSLLHLSLRSQIPASNIPFRKGQLVFQMFYFATKWFFVPSASIPMLLFAILLPNLQEEIPWEYNLLPFTSAPLLVR